MPDQPPKLLEVGWLEWFPWLILVRSVRIALMARVMVLGALGLIAMTLGWRAIGWVFPESDDRVIQGWHQSINQWLWDNAAEFSMEASAASAADLFVWAATGLPKAPVSLWLYLTRPFMELFSPELTAAGFAQLLICCLWTLLVWGLFGGAITRIAALKLTRDEAPGFFTALKYAADKLLSYSLAPAIALAGAAVFAIQLMVLGLAMQLNVIAMIAALVWPFVLLLGLLMAILLLGALVGWPLMWATVSVEGTDAFDALSRSYAYTYQRPWRLLWYVLFAAFLAAVSMFVVRLFAASAIELGNWSIDWGLDDQTMRQVVKPDVPPPAERSLAPPATVAAATPTTPETEAPPDAEEATPTAPPAVGPTLAPPVVADDDTPTAMEVASEPEPDTDEVAAKTEPQLGLMLRIAAWAIDRWKLMVNALAAGYQAGFLWASAVAVYLLLRRDIDGVELNEVNPGPEDDFGAPSLTDDAVTDVPDVASREPARRGDSSSEL